MEIDIAILLDNLYHTTPPRKTTITQPLAELLLKQPAHDNLYHIELDYNCYELWPLDEWKLYDSLGRNWPEFWSRYHERRAYLELSPRQHREANRRTEKQKRIEMLEKVRDEAAISGDIKRLQAIKLALILNRNL